MLHRFVTWLFSPFPEGKSSTSYSIEEFKDLKVKDLRKILYGFGVTRFEAKSVLDKEELSAWALSLLEEERKENLNALLYAKAWRYTVIVLLATLLYVSREPAGALVQQVVNHYLMVKYDIKVKVDMIKVALKEKMFLSVLALGLVIVLDVTYEWVQLSTFASWVVPRDAYFLRKLMFPFHMDLPVNAGMVMGENMKRSGFGQQLGGFGVNLGPMILLACIRYTKHTLQEYSAGCIHGSVFGKQQRKEQRREERRRRAEAEAEPEFPSMDDELDEQKAPHGYSPDDMDAKSNNPRSHLPSWPKKPPHMMNEGTGEVDGYVYSNDNDPGAEAQAREDAERAYRVAMAEKEEGFKRYLAMQAEMAKEKERVANAARQEMEDLLAGVGKQGEGETLDGVAEDGWADGSDDESRRGEETS
jgi:hypothetical protein